MHTPNTLLGDHSYLEMLQVQSNAAPSMSALRPMHSRSPQFRRYFIGVPRSLVGCVGFRCPWVGLLHLHKGCGETCQDLIHLGGCSLFVLLREKQNKRGGHAGFGD
jgi:hypothetical protein